MTQNFESLYLISSLTWEQEAEHSAVGLVDCGADLLRAMEGSAWEPRCVDRIIHSCFCDYGGIDYTLGSSVCFSEQLGFVTIWHSAHEKAMRKYIKSLAQCLAYGHLQTS